MESTLTFISPLPTIRGDVSMMPCSFCRLKFYRSNAYRRRGRVWASASEQTAKEPDISSTNFKGTVTDHVDFEDDIVSDETHVVIDRKDIDELIEQLKISGEDSFLSGSETQDDISSEYVSEFFNAAERLVDERDGHFTATRASIAEASAKLQAEQAEWSEDVSNTVEAADANDWVAPNDQDKTDENDRVTPNDQDKQLELINDDVPDYETMDYFKSENKMYMPSWAREMFENDEHVKLEEGSKELSQKTNNRRLHEIVERKKANPITGDKVLRQGDGIVDCTVVDVADDYRVPVEFVIDIMISYGAQLPIKPTHSIRDSLTRDEINQMLKIFLTYDSSDLSERYSDRTITELADDYDVHSDEILRICEREGLYVHAGPDTHLSIVYEDRVLGILFNEEPYGKPYPPLLEGLE